MKLVLQNIFFCCLLATFLSCCRSAPLQLTSAETVQLEIPCVPEEDLRDSAELLSQSNETDELGTAHRQMSERVKRGCNLLTCSVHDLAHRINQLSKRRSSVPQEKISPQGYGRRRRRSLPHRSAPRRRGDGRDSLPWLHAQRRSAPQTQT